MRRSPCWTPWRRCSRWAPLIIVNPVLRVSRAQSRVQLAMVLTLAVVQVQAGRFEGKALDNSVVVTLNGKMEPLSCTVRGTGNSQDHQILEQSTRLHSFIFEEA